MKTIYENCPAVKSFVDYWDKWHKEWYAITVKAVPTNNSLIDCWEFPTPIWRYFPEPYWGDPYTKNLAAVFLNINPGAGGESQDIKHSPVNDPILTYLTPQKTYSRTVEILSGNSDYDTTEWFYNKRVKWLKKLLECINKSSIQNLTVQNIICADLIPWHTPTVDSFVTNLIDKKSICIVDKVIEPIVSISQCADIKGLVFAKGAVTESLLYKLVGLPIEKYSNGDYRITVFEYNGARIIVFIGGQGMSLPNPCNIYENNESFSKISIADIVANSISEIEKQNKEEDNQIIVDEKDNTFDTIIVPTGITLSGIKKHNQYVCQSYRPIKTGIKYIAFYINKEIVGYGKILSFNPDSFGNIVYQLENFNSLSIPHIGKYAYVQNRRYCSLSRLFEAASTSEI